MAMAVMQIGHVGVTVHHRPVHVGMGVTSLDRPVVRMVVVPIVVAVLVLVLHRLMNMLMVVSRFQ